ncbi:MAG: ABC transporter permease subunit [Planctomycetota bacterium]|nr:ABC transporter permease subunit [Planctomycetota bacterium]
MADRLFLAIENPVLRRELLTALRSNKAFILQFIFLLALGAVVYLAWPAGIISTSPELTRKLFRTFGQGQLVMLSILSPAFSASAMTIEKERRCIDLLLTSPIRPGTILMGKYMSSVLYLFLLVLSTAPLVTVIMWLPGLGPVEVIGLYVLLIGVAAAFGMVGLTCSVFFHRSQASLAITYMIVLPLALILLACALGFDGFFLLESAVWPAGILLVATVVMYRACHARLRRPFDPVFKAAEEEDVATQTGLVLVRDRFPDKMLAPRDVGLLPDGVNPVYQKEIRSEIFGRGTLFLRLIIQISMFLSVVFLTFLYLSREHIFVYYLVIFTMLVAPAFACNTFTQERERGTLDLLLTTLVRPAQIVTGKFLSCMRLSLFLTGLVGVTMAFYVFVGHDEPGLRIIYLVVYILILLTTIIFETSLAMFFSLHFRGTVQSMITTYTVLLFLFAAPVAAEELLIAFTKLQRSEMFYLLLVTPFDAVYSVSSKGASAAAAVKEQFVMIWPYYVGLYLTLSGLLMGYVYSAFERKSLETAKVQ